MSAEIQFYSDQHYPGPVIQGLRRQGTDVLSAQDAGRRGLPDEQQLAFATANERVMLTFDTDYLALHHSCVQHRGIVWCPHRKCKFGDLIRLLLLHHGVTDRRWIILDVRRIAHRIRYTAQLVGLMTLGPVLGRRK